MSSLWTDLLYLHGYLTDPKLARRLVEKTEESSREGADSVQPDTKEPPQHESRHSRFRGNDGNPGSSASKWYARLCLGIGDGALHWQ